MEKLIAELLEHLGESAGRPGLEQTPARVARMWRELTEGYGQEGTAVLEPALFASDSTGLVVCRGIDFVSTCEHHLLPFYGKATIAYLPGGRLVGISKLVRLTELYAHRLQVQERMGQQILDSVEAALRPRGALVHLEATHLCMVARGVRQPNARMVTTHVTGLFDSSPERVAAVVGGGCHE